MVAQARVIVAGASGMLGSDLVPALRAAGHEVLAFDLAALDITNRAAVLALPKADILINCAAYTAVDKAEEERERCKAVNVTGVEHLAEYCRAHDVMLVQLSTDYVFDGSKQGYDEQDPLSPMNWYGQTKADAETIVRALPKHQIIRTSWLFGHHGVNFVDKIVRILKEKGEAHVVDDQRGAPTYTKHLADAIVAIIALAPGTYHATAAGSCSWYEFAQEINNVYALGGHIAPTTSADRPTPARRPAYSILNSNKGPRLPPWQEGLRAYARESQ